MAPGSSPIRRAAVRSALWIAILWPIPAAAQGAYLAVDVPSTLQGTEVSTSDVALHDPGSNTTIAESLPASVHTGGLQFFADGTYLFSMIRPVEVGGLSIEPRDVARYESGVTSLYLSGSALGIPDNAGIDALFFDDAARAVMSFSVPVEIDGTRYGDSDLVILDDGFSLYWDATLEEVPPYANLAGASLNTDGDLVLSFDVPVELDGTIYRRGELIKWTGTGFSTFSLDPFWPAGSQQRGLSFSGTEALDPKIFADGFESGDTAQW